MQRGDIDDDTSRAHSPQSSRWAVALRRLLQQNRMTQAELAIRAGLDKNTVANVLRGHSVSTSTLERLAQALGVDVSELVSTDAQARILAEAKVNAGAGLSSEIVREVVDAVERILERRHVRSPEHANRPPRAVGPPYLGPERRSAHRRGTSDRRSGWDRRSSSGGIF